MAAAAPDAGPLTVRRLGPDGTPLWSTLVVGAGNGASQARCVRQAPASM